MKKAAKTTAFLLVLLVTVLMLTGCGEQKKYDKAAALEAEGKYYEAYQAFIGLKDFQDARQKADEVWSAAYNAAQTALAEGRYDEAAGIASPFSFNVHMKDIVNFAENAKNGTYVKELALSEDGKISFTAAIDAHAGDENGAPKLRVALKVSGNGRASGRIHTSEKNEKSTKEGYFIPEEYLRDGEYVVTEAPLDAWLYDASPRGLTIIDFNELADSTLVSFQTLQMAHFPIAYQAIMNDGTEGAVLSEWGCSNLQFRDIMKTFAGGTASVEIVSADEKTTLFSLSLDIPEKEET